jgi:hypothetical protein
LTVIFLYRAKNFFRLPGTGQGAEFLSLSKQARALQSLERWQGLAQAESACPVSRSRNAAGRRGSKTGVVGLMPGAESGPGPKLKGRQWLATAAEQSGKRLPPREKN